MTIKRLITILATTVVLAVAAGCGGNGGNGNGDGGNGGNGGNGDAGTVGEALLAECPAVETVAEVTGLDFGDQGVSEHDAFGEASCVYGGLDDNAGIYTSPIRPGDDPLEYFGDEDEELEEIGIAGAGQAWLGTTTISDNRVSYRAYVVVGDQLLQTYAESSTGDGGLQGERDATIALAELVLSLA